MELLIESGSARKDDLAELLDETNQLIAMTVSSIKTVRRSKS